VAASSARFLNRIRDAYAEHGDVENLLMVPYFTEAVANAQDAWRRVVTVATEQGVAIPAFASSLSYYDGYRRERGPANLIQGLRDFFGAHTYRRIDAEGYWHTRWSAGRPRCPPEATHPRPSPTPGRSRSSGPTPTRGPPSSQADASVEPSGRPKGNQPSTPHTPHRLVDADEERTTAMTVGSHPDVALGAQPIDQLTVNTIRTLAMDAVQAANSGHPGTPMALAPVGYTLWTRFLRFDPELPVWANRDRFVLSAGHASTLLYACCTCPG
jgi:hypothetical protein